MRNTTHIVLICEVHHKPTLKREFIPFAILHDLIRGWTFILEGEEHEEYTVTVDWAFANCRLHFSTA